MQAQPVTYALSGSLGNGTARTIYRRATLTIKALRKQTKNVNIPGRPPGNFKSDLIYYNVPGKYIDAILEPVVKPWIIQARRELIDPRILEEDGDSGHRGGGGVKLLI